jgi:hypothetical protein
MALRRMYDSIVVASMPTDGDLYAGYVNGRWPTFPKLATTFPKATPVSISISADRDAQVLDVETGDATPAQAVPWALRQRKAGRTPTVYANTSTWPAVKAAFHIAGVILPLWWESHYDAIPVLSPGAIAKQYSTGSYDISVVAPYWPGIDPTPSEDDMTPTEMLAALDAAAKSTEAGTPVLGTEFIDGLARRVAAIIKAQGSA